MTSRKASSASLGAQSKTAARQQLLSAFRELSAILWPYERYLNVTSDTPRRYYLQTKSPSFQRKPLFFASVLSRHVLVTYHLMPLYWDPSIAAKISPALQKHRVGLTGFTFTAPDAKLLKEVAALTRKGFDLYKRKNLL